MIINHTTKERDLLARLMRAEALSEGDLGMLMVGNVVVNRGIANCLTFKDIRTITDVIYQSPGGFSGKDSPNALERKLADRVLRGDYFFPATNALWFYAPKINKSCASTWWEQNLAGRYKNHCFYKPDAGTCTELY